MTLCQRGLGQVTSLPTFRSFTRKCYSVDRRRYSRVAVEYTASFSGEAYRTRGTILNLSMLGCRARITFRIKTGERIGMLIEVPGSDHPLYVSRADVQWANEEEVGMEFIHMEWGDRQRLAEIVRSIESAG